MAVEQWVSLGFLIIVYGGSGIAELFLWKKSVDQFVAWGYPQWWAIVTPVIKIVAGILLVFSNTQVFGVLLCGAVAIAASITVLWHQEKSAYKAAFPVTLLTLLSAGFLLF